MTAETSNARGEWVLERLRGVLEHGKMGDKCLIAPDLVTAAIASLSAPQQPEAQGVVDEGSRSVTRQLLHWGGIPVHVTGTVTTSPGNWSLIDAALATQQQGGSDDA